MPLAPALEKVFDSLRRSAVSGLRGLLLVSMVLFAAQPAGALATHHAMDSYGAGMALVSANVAPPAAQSAQTHDTDCCQPAQAQPACPDCAAVSCAAAPATLAGAATIRIFRQPLRHAFFDPAFALSPHSTPPELGPPRA